MHIKFWPENLKERLYFETLGGDDDNIKMNITEIRPEDLE
jgi:hypothetical protein